MERFLLALNASESSEVAALLARQLLETYSESELIALYVTEMIPDRNGYRLCLGVEYENELLSHIQAKLCTLFSPSQIQRVRFRHRQGTNPAKVICQAAIEFDCDLVVVGRDRKECVRRLIYGSVTYEVLNYAKMSVLVA